MSYCFASITNSNLLIIENFGHTSRLANTGKV